MNQATRTLAHTLYRMTMPMIIGVLAIMSNQLIDSAFIGQLGVKPLAVVGFSIPVYQLIIGIQVGIGIATTALISRALGAKRSDQARQLGGLVVMVGFISILLLCIVFWLEQETLLNLLGAQTDIYYLVREYWAPWLVSCWLGAMTYFAYSIYRAHGYTKLPGILMVLTSIINIILDPLLIFTFDMGIAGAAWATIIAYVIGAIIIFPKIFVQNWVRFPARLQESLADLKSLFSIMLPAMVSQFIPPVSAMIATVIVARYGENVIAAWGLGARIEYFSIIIILALTMALPPIIGRLVGRNELTKVHLLVKLAMGFVLIWQLLIAFVGMGASVPISQLLTTDLSVSTILCDYLWIVPLSYGALGICMIAVSVCNAMGMSFQALTISALRLLCFYLPFLWLGSTLAGLHGLFIGAMLGNFAAGIMSWFMYKKSLVKLGATLT